MTSDDLHALLAKPLDAIVAVDRPSGGPQVTPNWFVWDGEAFYLSTTRSRSKYPNIKRNPDISIIVNDQAAHRYVAAYGRAEIVEDDYDTIARLTIPIIEKYMPGGSQGFVANLREQGRVVIVLRPDKLVTN